MNKQKLLSIGRTSFGVLSFIVSVMQIVDFTNTMVNKYRKPKKVEGFGTTTES
jgi:hypothetical protein